MEEIAPLLFVYRNLGQTRVIEADQCHRFGPRRKTPWVGWTCSKQPIQVTIRSPYDNFRGLAIGSTSKGTVIEIDGEVVTPPVPGVVAADTAQNIVNVELIGDLGAEILPTFVTESPSGETIAFDALIQLSSQRLSELPHFQVQIAHNNFMHHSDAVSPDTDSAFIPDSLTRRSKFYQFGAATSISPGLFLPFEIHLDIKIFGVLKLESTSGNNVFRATMFTLTSIHEMPSLAGAILRRRIRWDGKDGPVNSDFEFGKVLSLKR